MPGFPFGEIVLTLMSELIHAPAPTERYAREVIAMMEESDVRRKDMSEMSMEFSSMGENIGDDLTKFQCYNQCVDDAWDFKSEFICASSCGLEA